MENLIQIYLPAAALLIVVLNSLFVKKTFINWLPMVFILAGLDKFLGEAVVGNEETTPSIVRNGAMSILIITTFLALSYRQFLREKGRKFQLLSLGLVYLIGALLALMIQGNFTSGLTVFNGPKLLLGVVLNLLMVAVVFIKFPFLNKWLKLKEDESRPVLFNGLLIMIVALSVYLGVFVTGWYGVAFFASMFLPSLIILSDSKTEQFLQQGIFSVLAILGLTYIISFGGGIQFQIGHSHFIWGLFIGGFILVLGRLMNLISDSSKALIVVVLAMVLTMVYAFGYLYEVKENLGGLITYAGMLIGTGLLVFNQEKHTFSYPMSTGLLTLSAIILLAPVFEVVDPFADKGSSADKIEADQKKVEVTNEKGEKVVLELNDITEAQGKWEIFLDNSKLKFIVVSHGNTTKGTFKQYSGTIRIAENLADCEVELEFDASSISTFNKVRDKEVKNGEDWMNVPKFPKIQFKAKGFQLEGDSYKTIGELTMKGITKEVPVTFVFDGKGENEGKDFIIVSGKLSMDMTNFGIPESSEVDKGVEVEFTVEANKIE